MSRAIRRRGATDGRHRVGWRETGSPACRGSSGWCKSLSTHACERRDARTRLGRRGLLKGPLDPGPDVGDVASRQCRGDRVRRRGEPPRSDLGIDRLMQRGGTTEDLDLGPSGHMGIGSEGQGPARFEDGRGPLDPTDGSTLERRGREIELVQRKFDVFERADQHVCVSQVSEILASPLSQGGAELHAPHLCCDLCQSASCLARPATDLQREAGRTARLNVRDLPRLLSYFVS
jgi:hypothetical protein